MFCNTLYKALCDDGSQFLVIQLDDGVRIVWRKRSIPTHSGWLYPLTFDAEKGLKEA